MISPQTKSMLWEIWRTNWHYQIFRILLMTSTILFAIWFAGIKIRGIEDTVVTNGIFVMIFVMLAGSSEFWFREFDPKNEGFRYRLWFARPVSTWKLAGILLGINVLIAAVYFLIPVLTVNLFRESNLPVLGPLVWLVFSVVVLSASVIGPKSILGKIECLFASIIALTILLQVAQISFPKDEPFLMMIGRSSFYTSSILPTCILGIAALGMSFFAARGLQLQRQGEQFWLEEKIEAWASWLATIGPGRVGSGSPQGFFFRGPFAAQFWVERRRCQRPVLLFGFAIPTALLLFMLVGKGMNPEFNGELVGWILGLLLCPFFFQILAAENVSGLRVEGEVVRFSLTDATRNLTCGQLVVIKMLVSTLAMLFGWCVMLLFVVGYLFVTGDGIESVGALAGLVPIFSDWTFLSWATLSIALLLFYICSYSLLYSATLLIPLYTRWFYALLGVVLAHLLLVAWDGLQGWPLINLWVAYGYLFFMASILSSAYLIWVSLNSGFVTSGYAVLAGSVWGVYVVCSFTSAIQLAGGLDVQLVHKLVFMGVLITPLGALLLAPWSLAQFRHEI